MAASQVERSKARSLRKKKGPLSPDQRAWLDVYEQQHPTGGIRPDPIPEPANSPIGPVEGTVGPSAPQTSAPVAPPPSPATGADVDLPDGFFVSEPPALATVHPIQGPEATDQAAAPSPTTSSACGVPECPRCKAAEVVPVCGVTGQKVWPPMSEAGAKGMAAALLGLIAIAIYVAKKKHAPKPTPRERDALASALREVQRRRVNELGAVDDIVGLAWVLLAYGKRSLKEAE